MPRKISAVSVPVDLAHEIDRLLHCAEAIPLIGQDAQRARRALARTAPRVFAAPPREAYTACAVCEGPVPFARQVHAAQCGAAARYCSDQCRETARKRRYRAQCATCLHGRDRHAGDEGRIGCVVPGCHCTRYASNLILA